LDNRENRVLQKMLLGLRVQANDRAARQFNLNHRSWQVGILDGRQIDSDEPGVGSHMLIRLEFASPFVKRSD
jgi:hypothetical protein